MQEKLITRYDLKKLTGLSNNGVLALIRDMHKVVPKTIIKRRHHYLESDVKAFFRVYKQKLDSKPRIGDYDPPHQDTHNNRTLQQTNKFYMLLDTARRINN